MNFWIKQTTRWTGEQLASWSSVSKTVYVLLPLLIYYLVTDITDVVLWWGLNGIAGSNEKVITFAGNYSGTIKGLIYFTGVIIFLFFIKDMTFSEIDKKALSTEIKKKEWLFIVVITLAIAIFLNYALYYMGLTNSSQSYGEIKENLYSVNVLSGLFFYGICSPFAEEILFRGIIYNRMKRIFPKIFSIVISAILFGVFHGNIVQGIYGTLMGLLITLLYEKYGNFKVPVVVHMVANLGVYVLTYTIWK